MISIRPYEAADLEDLYAISLKTGDRGEDATLLFDDPQMMGHIYSAPYGVLKPELCFVAQDDEGVVGFSIGVLDTPAFELLLETGWWPDLRKRYADPGPVLNEDWTADQKRSFMIHHPGRTPVAVTDACPAHMHLNLLPRAHRKGVGSRLIESWLEKARSLGCKHVHVGVNARNQRGLLFWQASGFATINMADDLAADASPVTSVWLGRSTS